jgi:hypothetical protein
MTFRKKINIINSENKYFLSKNLISDYFEFERLPDFQQKKKEK